MIRQDSPLSLQARRCLALAAHKCLVGFRFGISEIASSGSAGRQGTGWTSPLHEAEALQPGRPDPSCTPFTLISLATTKKLGHFLPPALFRPCRPAVVPRTPKDPQPFLGVERVVQSLRLLAGYKLILPGH